MNRQERINFIKALNTLILGLGDEDHLDYWFTCGVPDQPDESDFEFIAEDEGSFDEVVNCFIRLSKYLKTGIYIDNKFYKGQIKV